MVGFLWIVLWIFHRFHRSVGSNPSRDTCVLKQNALLLLLFFTQGYKWVPMRVDADIVHEKAFGAP